MTDFDAMLDAHVQFELKNWNSEGFSATVTEEITELFTWLESVALDEVLTGEFVAELVQKYMFEDTFSDEMAHAIAGAVRTAHAAALNDDTVVSELMSRDVYDQFARTVVGMKELRTAFTDQFTTSEVYVQLMSHVLYQGIKNYLVSESIVARKVPGASSLMKLGQNALSAAAPKLDKAIDRQLTAFVNSNISDSVAQSRHYLDTVLDEELLMKVADEFWNTNANAKVSGAAGLITEAQLDELLAAATEAWRQVRIPDSASALTDQVVNDVLTQFGHRPIAELLAEAGITPELVSGIVTDVALPLITRAEKDGYIEDRIRTRLAAFYTTYKG